MEHYSTDVLDTAARQPEFFDGLSGYTLLEACIVFAGKHFRPTKEIGDVLLRAEQKGLMVNSWRSGSLVAGKVILTTPIADPLSKLALRFAKAHHRECERREELLAASSRASATNTLIKGYYGTLLRYGRSI